MPDEAPTDSADRLMDALDRIQVALTRIEDAQAGCAVLASRHAKLRERVTWAVASLDELLKPPSDG